MIQTVLLFILGLILICLGGDRLVDAAVAIAKKLGIPEIVIGATIVSLGTTLPEILVSTTAAFDGSAAIAAGNAFGSIICNTALIAGLTQTIRPSKKIEAAAIRWRGIFFFAVLIGMNLYAYLTQKFNRPAGIVLILLPFGNALLPVGLVVAGLGCAPIYPSIIHETPSNFGKNLSMSMTGLQMAAAYTGSTLLSPLFGVLAQNITMKLYPFVLLLMLVLMTVFSEQLHRKTAAKRAGNA